MSRQPAIAVLHYNKIRLTTRCLDSLLAANILPERIHCLDNGSGPDVLPQLEASYPGVRHHRLETNRGYSGGFNAALNRVFGSGYTTCVFLTNDTVFYSGADNALAETLAIPGVGLAAPCIHYLSKPDQIDSLGAFFNPETASLGHYHDIDLPLTLQPGRDYIPGTALAIHRDAFVALGGADESFHTYWEDVDLCFRAHSAGIRLERCPAARIGHGVGQTCHKKPLYTTFLFQRNRLIFCRRHLVGDARCHAEKVICADWQKMRQRCLDKGDKVRLGYLDELFQLATPRLED